MTSQALTSKEETIAVYRQRYEALEAAGQAPKALPGPSPRPAPSRPVVRQETIPGGWYTTIMLSAGETMRLQTGDRPSSVSLIAWHRHDPSERLNVADSVKVQWTTVLEKGRVIFSDMGRVIFSVVEDSGAFHDALVGGSTAGTNARRYGEGFRNTRDNFTLAASKFGLAPRDIPPCLTFFAPVRLDDDGRFVWLADKRQAGDYVDLRAEMDLLIAISNCPHPLDPAMRYEPASIELLLLQSLETQPDDLCRTATDEARRGFENNAALAL